jgi:hypothetical protein
VVGEVGPGQLILILFKLESKIYSRVDGSRGKMEAGRTWRTRKRSGRTKRRRE